MTDEGAAALTLHTRRDAVLQQREPQLLDTAASAQVALHDLPLRHQPLLPGAAAAAAAHFTSLPVRFLCFLTRARVAQSDFLEGVVTKGADTGCRADRDGPLIAAPACSVEAPLPPSVVQRELLLYPPNR